MGRCLLEEEKKCKIGDRNPLLQKRKRGGWKVGRLEGWKVGREEGRLEGSVIGMWVLSEPRITRISRII